MSAPIDHTGAARTDVSDTSGFGGHPRGLPTLFFTEMWERFSYYGLRPLLVLFMSAALMQGGFGFDRGQASAIVGIYAASVYLASLPGGWIADRLLGLRRAILYGAICISAGHISIGLSAFAGGKLTFFLGLILIVCGTGLLKPNISAIVGDLYPEGGARRDAGFSIFYMGINLGAFLGQIVTGFLGETIGWHWGFGAAGVGMLVGLAVFATRSRTTLGDIGARPTPLEDPAAQRSRERRAKLILGVGLGALALVVVLAAVGAVTLDAQVIGQYMTFVLVGLAVLFFGFLFVAGGLDSDEKKRVLLIAVLFVFAAIFWSAFEQAPTSLNLFAKDFTERNLGGFEVPAVWFQSVNSAFIILLAPVFAALWGWLGARKLDLSSPVKFSLGLLFAGVGFFIMIFAANIVAAGGGAVKVSAMWLVGSYFFQTIGELCLSPVGLSSMTKLSPRRYVGQMMGIWFLASAVGNLIAGLVGGHVDPNKLEQMPQLFTATTASLVVSAIALGLLAIPIRRMMQKTEGRRAVRVEGKGEVKVKELSVHSPVATE
jgi:POT family proton-dependent oligopeptide transporter